MYNRLSFAFADWATTSSNIQMNSAGSKWVAEILVPGMINPPECQLCRTRPPLSNHVNVSKQPPERNKFIKCRVVAHYTMQSQACICQRSGRTANFGSGKGCWKCVGCDRTPGGEKASCNAAKAVPNCFCRHCIGGTDSLVLIINHQVRKGNIPSS